jgi:ATP-dependent exoDNAse (exonuclease V) beta subunit
LNISRHSCLQKRTARPRSSPSEIAGRYTEIMVDEYQDVSEVQDAIFRAVSRDGKNLFMVGDVKQAIYRFRLADPAIFIQKYNSFRPAADAAPGEPRLVLLRENFRSRKEIIDGANSVFSACMSRALGEVTYDDAPPCVRGQNMRARCPCPSLPSSTPPPIRATTRRRTRCARRRITPPE